MPFDFKIHELAYKEYIEGYLWYEAINIDLGNRFMLAVERKIKQIVENPEYFSRLRSNYRNAKVEGFPYTIVYEFFPRLNIIHIAAIFHTKRNPKKKYRKFLN